jgi:hypothetical protein
MNGMVGKNPSKPKSTLRRPIHPMPDFVEEALAKNGLVAQYRSRPPYQRNDYIGWISRAKLDGTKQKRLKQMIEELRKGDVYMKMTYGPKSGGTWGRLA